MAPQKKQMPNTARPSGAFDKVLNVYSESHRLASVAAANRWCSCPLSGHDEVPNLGELKSVLAQKGFQRRRILQSFHFLRLPRKGQNVEYAPVRVQHLQETGGGGEVWLLGGLQHGTASAHLGIEGRRCCLHVVLPADYVLAVLRPDGWDHLVGTIVLEHAGDVLQAETPVAIVFPWRPRLFPIVSRPCPPVIMDVALDGVALMVHFAINKEVHLNEKLIQ